MTGFLDPIRMNPAFRYGSMTPWGGDGLQKMGKKIPDPRTGESLEVSALAGLESRDDDGRTLTELQDRYGAALTGTAVKGPFPLLFKLISAREWLSVQVHPDDEYARLHENGKLGKAEAWVILDAAEDAKIIYGVREGITREQLRAACAAGGRQLQECLRFVPVHAGDVYSIPAGTLHALSGGITIAEIQQSSDLVYRFYDWDRVDAQGRGRPLHIEKGLDVLNLAAIEQEKPMEITWGGVSGLRCVHNAAFALDRFMLDGTVKLTATPAHFRILMFLDDGCMENSRTRLDVHRGDSVLLPAMLAETRLTAKGQVLVMTPGVNREENRCV